MNTNALTLFACGGTLDKDYNPLNGELGFDQTHLPQLLALANHQLPISLQTLMLKDSLEMDQQDRETIYQACLTTPSKLIVITHGTDTMADSADYLHQRASQLMDKTLVLTGAMRPFRLGDSDALFNLGAALMTAQLSPPGVYICMNGQRFAAGQVSKNRQLGVFVSQ